MSCAWLADAITAFSRSQHTRNGPLEVSLLEDAIAICLRRVFKFHPKQKYSVLLLYCHLHFRSLDLDSLPRWKYFRRADAPRWNTSNASEERVSLVGNISEEWVSLVGNISSVHEALVGNISEERVSLVGNIAQSP